MTIPKVKEIMLPLLKFVQDGHEHTFTETIPFLANYFNLTEEEQNILIRSQKKRSLFTARVYEAKKFLTEAGLLESSYYKYFIITSKGLELLAENPQSIDSQLLKKYTKNNTISANEEVQQKSKVECQFKELDEKISKVEEQKIVLENAYQELQKALAREILETIKQCSSNFFESLVVDLLVSMGYGGSRKEAGQAVGKSGDEGIDGIIKEDRLGLDIIYLQAKRWENVVGRPEIHKFAGALQGQKAKKGIFITTSDFTKDAIEYVSKIDTKIILLNGNRLTELMIEHNVGVSPIAKYEVKKIDSDYFLES